MKSEDKEYINYLEIQLQKTMSQVVNIQSTQQQVQDLKKVCQNLESQILSIYTSIQQKENISSFYQQEIQSLKDKLQNPDSKNLKFQQQVAQINLRIEQLEKSLFEKQLQNEQSTNEQGADGRISELQNKNDIIITDINNLYKQQEQLSQLILDIQDSVQKNVQNIQKMQSRQLSQKNLNVKSENNAIPLQLDQDANSKIEFLENQQKQAMERIAEMENEISLLMNQQQQGISQKNMFVSSEETDKIPQKQLSNQNENLGQKYEELNQKLEYLFEFIQQQLSNSDQQNQSQQQKQNTLLMSFGQGPLQDLELRMDKKISEAVQKISNLVKKYVTNQQIILEGVQQIKVEFEQIKATFNAGQQVQQNIHYKYYTSPASPNMSFTKSPDKSPKRTQSPDNQSLQSIEKQQNYRKYKYPDKQQTEQLYEEFLIQEEKRKTAKSPKQKSTDTFKVQEQNNTEQLNEEKRRARLEEIYQELNM